MGNASSDYESQKLLEVYMHKVETAYNETNI